MNQPSLILLHGALGSKASLEPLRTILSKQFDVHSFNLPGHGGLPLNTPYTMASFAARLESYVLEQQLERPHVFGFSMGGYVALSLARSRPDLLGKILTLGTKFSWTPAGAAQEVRMLNPEKIAEKVPRYAQALAKAHHPQDWQEVVQATGNLLSGLGAGEGRLEEADFHAIEQEVLIGLGEDDQMVSREESMEVAGWLPNGELKVLEDTPHPIEKVEAKRLARVIGAFLG